MGWDVSTLENLLHPTVRVQTPARRCEWLSGNGLCSFEIPLISRDRPVGRRTHDVIVFEFGGFDLLGVGCRLIADRPHYIKV